MALSLGGNTLAATVYQWTDADGLVHFSDTPPKGDSPGDILEIEFVDYAVTDTDPEQYSITSQLEQMAEWRKQIEEERNARKQLQLEARRLDQERHAALAAGQGPDPYYVPVLPHHNSGLFFGRGFGHGFGHGRHISGKHLGRPGHHGGIGRFGGEAGKGSFGKPAAGGRAPSTFEVF